MQLCRKGTWPVDLDANMRLTASNAYAYVRRHSKKSENKKFFSNKKINLSLCLTKYHNM